MPLIHNCRKDAWNTAELDRADLSERTAALQQQKRRQRARGNSQLAQTAARYDERAAVLSRKERCDVGGSHNSSFLTGPSSLPSVVQASQSRSLIDKRSHSFTGGALTKAESHRTVLDVKRDVVVTLDPWEPAKSRVSASATRLALIRSVHCRLGTPSNNGLTTRGAHIFTSGSAPLLRKRILRASHSSAERFGRRRIGLVFVLLGLSLLAGRPEGARPGPAATRGTIAYSERGHLWVVEASGRGARRITSSAAARDFDPSWSPDGRRIAFRSMPASAGPTSRASSIEVVNVDGSGRHRVSPKQDVEEPAWSPDGTLIAFQLRGRIALVRPDGLGFKVLPIHGGCPSWSPDSRRLAICGNDGEIYTIGRDGKGRRRLTHAAKTDSPGPWSRDGKQLSFVGERDGDGDIFVINADGSGERRVTNFPGTEAPNAWLGNGEIVFPVYRSASASWLSIHSDGRGLKRLAQLKIRYDPIDWHE